MRLAQSVVGHLKMATQGLGDVTRPPCFVLSSLAVAAFYVDLTGPERRYHSQQHLGEKYGRFKKFICYSKVTPNCF